MGRGWAGRWSGRKESRRAAARAVGGSRPQISRGVVARVRAIGKVARPEFWLLIIPAQIAPCVVHHRHFSGQINRCGCRPAPSIIARRGRFIVEESASGAVRMRQALLRFPPGALASSRPADKRNTPCLRLLRGLARQPYKRPNAQRPVRTWSSVVRKLRRCGLRSLSAAAAERRRAWPHPFEKSEVGAESAARAAAS